VTDLAAWLARPLFAPDAIADDIMASVNAAELTRRQFREIARVSGLILQRYPGGSKTARQLQSSSGLIHDVFAEYDPGNLLLEQARREVLERQLDGGRMLDALDAMRRARLVVAATRRPTPFAFPLFVERLRQTLTSEKLEDRIRRMLGTLEREADRRV
jgi:ATP-dependent Lhr-like helicase